MVQDKLRDRSRGDDLLEAREMAAAEDHEVDVVRFGWGGRKGRNVRGREEIRVSVRGRRRGRGRLGGRGREVGRG
jgi:hypothetical protein